MPSIEPKTSVLGFDNAAHLLRRASYYNTKTIINAYAKKTPQQALDDLFLFTVPKPITPLNDLNLTHISTVSQPTVQSTSKPIKNTIAWWCYNAVTNPTIQYKLSFWLHTLFISSKTGQNINSWRVFDYLELLRFHTNDSLKNLAIRMTRNPLMLYYLNNRVNTKNRPDQNYAREFLELFTILKGPQIEEGDYTNYTEHDVRQAARVFTGFTVSNTDEFTNRLNNFDLTTQIPWGTINVANHDINNKTFSAAFNNTTIQGGTTQATIQQELVDFVTMVFNQTATAKNYCRRLYRYFVGRNITPEIETDIIMPLANTMMTNDYNIMPVVKQLLCSQHFYDEDDSIIGDKIIGALIKSPMDLLFSMYSSLQINLPNPNSNSAALGNVLGIESMKNMALMSFVWLSPINVNGYPGYSSNPHYDKNWITISTLRNRHIYTINTVLSGYSSNGFLFKFNIHLFVRNSGHFSNPAIANVLLEEFYDLLFTGRPQGQRHTYFMEALLGGLSVINWQHNWNDYISTSDSTTVKIALDRLIIALIKSPEYQVM